MNGSVPEFSYKSIHGDNLHIVFSSMGESVVGHHFINNAPVDYSGWKTLDSPWARQDFKSPIVTVNFAGVHLVYDFEKWTIEGDRRVGNRNNKNQVPFMTTFPRIFPALALLASAQLHAVETLDARFSNPPAANVAAFEVTRLRCEQLVDPLGIDVTRPRLSWQLASAQRGAGQTAYEILVASSEAKLAQDSADLWNSGKVVSAQSLNVLYDGKPLGARQACYWKVRVWNQDGNVSAWSPRAVWSLGLLQPDDWRGQWIGKDEAVVPDVRMTGEWIWFPEGKPEAEAPTGTRYFRHSFDLPIGRKVKRAELRMTADNEFSAWVNGQATGGGNDFNKLTVLEIGTQLQPGRNVIAVEAKNTGADPNPAGLVGMLNIEFESGDRWSSPPVATGKCPHRTVPDWSASGLRRLGLGRLPSARRRSA